jgi:hypothetical protein
VSVNGKNWLVMHVHVYSSIIVYKRALSLVLAASTYRSVLLYQCYCSVSSQ